MNKTIAGLTAIAAALGCAKAHENLEPIQIPLNGCESIQPCGIVCYEERNNGNAVINLNDSVYAPIEVMVNCKLETLWATDKMLYLRKAEKQ